MFQVRELIVPLPCLYVFQVREFVRIVEEEAEAQIYGGLVKAPKVLADIIESLSAAVYIDCNFNLEIMWKVSFYCFFLSYLSVMLSISVDVSG